MSEKAFYHAGRGGRIKAKEFRCQFCDRLIKVRWGLGVDVAKHLHEKACGGER